MPRQIAAPPAKAPPAVALNDLLQQLHDFDVSAVDAMPEEKDYLLSFYANQQAARTKGALRKSYGIPTKNCKTLVACKAAQSHVGRCQITTQSLPNLLVGETFFSKAIWSLLPIDQHES